MFPHSYRELAIPVVELPHSSIDQGCWERGAESESGSGSINFQKFPVVEVPHSSIDQGCWERGVESESGSGSINFQKFPGAGVFREHFFI
jgi:hypothetical protein